MLQCLSLLLLMGWVPGLNLKESGVCSREIAGAGPLGKTRPIRSQTHNTGHRWIQIDRLVLLCAGCGTFSDFPDAEVMRSVAEASGATSCQSHAKLRDQVVLSSNPLRMHF